MDEFLKWLQGLVGQGNTNPEIQRTLESSYVRDTLFALATKPTHIRQRDILPIGREAFGAYRPLLGTIAIDPDITRNDFGYIGRNTITHEMGHHADFRNSIPGFDDVANVYFDYARRKQPEIYAASSKREFKAELFTQALDVLKTAEATLTPSYMQEARAAGFDPLDATWEELMYLVRQREETLPGTGAALFKILDHPFYRDHPINRVRTRQNNTVPTHGPSPF